MSPLEGYATQRLLKKPFTLSQHEIALMKFRPAQHPYTRKEISQAISGNICRNAQILFFIALTPS